jgi:hypothetical protein
VRARDKYDATPTSAARARTATGETAFQAESFGEENESQAMNPKIDNPAARKTADQARDIRHLWAAALVCIFHLV